jgi:hypothetical protein
MEGKDVCATIVVLSMEGFWDGAKRHRTWTREGANFFYLLSQVCVNVYLILCSITLFQPIEKLLFVFIWLFVFWLRPKRFALYCPWSSIRLASDCVFLAPDCLLGRQLEQEPKWGSGLEACVVASLFKGLFLIAHCVLPSCLNSICQIRMMSPNRATYEMAMVLLSFLFQWEINAGRNASCWMELKSLLIVFIVLINVCEQSEHCIRESAKKSSYTKEACVYLRIQLNNY